MSDPPPSEARRARFRFRYDDQHRMVTANGVFGGATPRGQFALNFYVELPEVPKELTYQLNPEGTLGPRVAETVTTQEYLRHVQVTVILEMAQAERMASWVKTRVDEYRARATRRRAKADNK